MRTLLLILVVGACSDAQPNHPDRGSLDELAINLTHAARELVYRGMLALQRRYYRDR